MSELTLRDRIMPVWDAITPFVTLNLLWIAVSLPLVTMIPATAALLYAMNRHAHGRSTGWSEFFGGLRAWFWRSYLWGGLLLLITVILIANIAFYAQLGQPWAIIPAALAAGLLLAWLVIYLPVFPLLLEQEQPSLKQALRNSVVIAARRPLPTLGTAALVALILLGSIFVFPPAWLFLTASLCAWLMNRLVLGAIARMKRAEQS